MSPALIRLLVANTPQARRRLAGIAAGVAVGVALFSLLFGSYLGLDARSARAGALTLNLSATAGTEDRAALTGPLAHTETQAYDGALIQVLTLGLQPGDSLTVPAPAVPEPGHFFASPALAALVAEVPPEQLGARFGTLDGVLDPAAVPSPDSLVALVGEEYEVLRADLLAQPVDSLGTGGYGVGGNYALVAIIGAIAILVPVLVFISIVTNLGAAERRERFATVRLIGATPRQLALVAAAETCAAAAVGALAGIGLAWLVRPLVARLSINEGTFFPEDLLIGPLASAVIALGIVAMVTGAAFWQILRSGPTPLGNAARAEEKPVHWWRLIPLGLGVLITVGFTLLSVRGVDVGQWGNVVILGFLLTLLGLLVAGPWLTRLLSTVLAAQAGSAAGVVAMNRMKRTPRATFRAVSGLVLAVFAVTVFAGAVTSERFEASAPEGPDRLPLSTLITMGEVREDPALLDRLGQIPGVGTVTEVFHTAEESDSEVPATFENGPGYAMTAASARELGLVVPGELADTEFVFIGDYLNGSPAEISPTRVLPGQRPEPSTLLVATDGSNAARETARTELIRSGAGNLPPMTRAEALGAGQQTLSASFTALANLGLAIVGLIATVSLAVATVSSVIDRRRTLGLLRLTGMPERTLTGIIVRETVLPLAAVILAAVGLGFLQAWGVLAGLTAGRRQLGWPEPSYLITLGAVFAVAAITVVIAARAAARITGRQSTRFE